MTKMVDTRTDDLVNPSHVDILSSESEQVKRALPLLLSAMKAFVSLKAAKKKGAAEAQENRWVWPFGVGVGLYMGLHERVHVCWGAACDQCV